MILAVGALSAVILIALAVIATRRSAPSLARVLSQLAASAALGFAWACWWGAAAIAQTVSPADEGRDLAMTGIVASLPTLVERGLRFDFVVQDCGGCSVQGTRVSLAWYSQPNADMLQDVPELHPGQQWQLTARLKQRHGVLNPHGFDVELWLIEQGLAATGSVRPARLTSEHKLLAQGQGGFWIGVERLRDATRSRMMAAAADVPRLNVLLALSIGDQRAVSPAEWAVYNATGVGHLLSISGLHITLFAVLVAGLVRWLWVRNQWLTHRLPAFTAAAWFGLLAAVLYALASGWQVPAQRTVLMLAMVALARSITRNPHPAHVLATAGFAVLLADPFAVLSPGAWFSFAAVAMLVLAGWAADQTTLQLAPTLETPGWLAKIRSHLTAASRMQIAVTLGMVPWSVLFFSQVSLVSPFANALAIPWISFLVTPLALAGALLVWVAEPLATLTLAIGGWLMWAADTGLQAMAQWTWATVSLPAPHPAVFVAAVLGAVIAIGMQTRWRWGGLALMLPLLFSPADRPADGHWRATFVDIGQGMAVLIQTPQRAWLYDTGPQYGPETDGGQRIIVPLLRALGLTRLDGVIVSHADNDHSGGALSVLKSVPAPWLLTTVNAQHAIRAAPLPQIDCAAGLAWQADGLTFETLHPPRDWLNAAGMKTNALSCTIRVSDGVNTLLLPGDLEAQQEALVLERHAGKLPATVLLAPHHGSRTSSTAAFLDAVAPQYAVFQAGYRNRFGHPREDVLDRYRQRGIEILRSDNTGAVMFDFASGRAGPPAISQWRDKGRRYWHWQGQLAGAQPAALP